MIYKKGLLASERLSPVSGNKWLDGLSILSYIKAWGVFWSNTSTDRPNSSVQLCHLCERNTFSPSDPFYKLSITTARCGITAQRLWCMVM
jgi:hypothetical protein